jgi:hypothetical protein
LQPGSKLRLDAAPDVDHELFPGPDCDRPASRNATGATDPLGRDASTLRFHAYDLDVTVFVEPTTGDFMAMTERFDDGGSRSVIVEQRASRRAIKYGRRAIGSRARDPVGDEVATGASGDSRA